MKTEIDWSKSCLVQTHVDHNRWIILNSEGILKVGDVFTREITLIESERKINIKVVDINLEQKFVDSLIQMQRAIITFSGEDADNLKPESVLSK